MLLFFLALLIALSSSEIDGKKFFNEDGRMKGGAACERLCSQTFGGKCINKRHNCPAYFAWSTRGGGLTPCYMNVANACHKQVREKEKCRMYDNEPDAGAAILAACRYCKGEICTRYGPNRGYHPDEGPRCATIVCNHSPGGCYERTGTCNDDDGTCSYPLKAKGSDCNTNGVCNEVGQCLRKNNGNDNYQKECWDNGWCKNNGEYSCPWCGEHNGEEQYCCNQDAYPKGHKCYHAWLGTNYMGQGHRCIAPSETTNPPIEINKNFKEGDIVVTKRTCANKRKCGDGVAGCGRHSHCASGLKCWFRTHGMTKEGYNTSGIGDFDNFCIKKSGIDGGIPGCKDTPEFDNGTGRGCDTYIDEGWCSDGKVIESWTAGSQYKHPELHCCACGKTEDVEFKVEPPKPKPCYTTNRKVCNHCLIRCAKKEKPS